MASAFTSESEHRRYDWNVRFVPEADISANKKPRLHLPGDWASDADQAVVTDTVVTSKTAANVLPSPALLTDLPSVPMPRPGKTSNAEPVGAYEKK